MTMLSTGSSQKYADNWESAFAGKKTTRSKGAAKNKGIAKKSAKSAAKPSRSRAKPRATVKKVKRTATKGR